MSDNDITWVTINGQHIPIGAGESKDDAVKKFLAKKKEDGVDRQEKQIENNKKVADELNKDRIESTQDKHDKVIKELSQDKYADGTYDTATLKPVDYENGYQVTFCQIGDNYNAKEYDSKVNEFLSASSDGRVSAGKFEGTPEISFNVSNRNEAVALAEKYNQISIWDWSANKTALAFESKYGEDDPRTIEQWMKCEIKTGGTGRRN